MDNRIPEVFDTMEKSGSHLPMREQLSVEAIGKYEYRGRNLWAFPVMQGLYGGQLMGQALKAAFLSMSDLDPSFVLHSYHCYFNRKVNFTSGIIYKVEHVRLGSKSCSLLVNGVQDDEVVFNCLVLFHKIETAGHEYDYCSKEMPEVPGPDTFNDSVWDQNDEEDSVSFLKMVCQFVQRLCEPFEVHTCSSKEPVEVAKPRVLYWLRTRPSNVLSEDRDHQTLHRIRLVYVADYCLALVALARRAHLGLPSFCSLDHSMWFYGPVNDGAWYLHCQELEHSVGGHTLNSSRIYSKDGQLIAICKQEGCLKSRL